MLKFNLIENAEDSLEHAIGHLTSCDDMNIGDYKRIILDLSHVVELLLKERLRMIHPAFVLSNVDKYPSQKVHTVTAEVALHRLKNIGDIDFKDEYHAPLEMIREKRNEIEHFEFAINEEEFKVVIGNILAFIFRFSCDEVGLLWAQRRLDDPEWRRLHEYASFYETQLESIKEQIEGAFLPISECPMCHNDTFDLEAEVCLLCGHSEEVLECSKCRDSYLDSMVEYEGAELCLHCEQKDAYASANYEKY